MFAAVAHALEAKAVAAARREALKVGAAKKGSAGKGLAVSVAEAVGRGAAKITKVISSLTGESSKRRSG